ncbi:MAG: hypothetical protein ABI868_12950 [Acidobacteriota bacterium]
MGLALRLLAVTLLVLTPVRASAEWQLKPFFGVSFAGTTTLLDVENAAGSANRVYGISGQLLGEVFGVEGDFGFAPGFFSGGDDDGVVGCRASATRCVLRSSVKTFTGNIVIAIPRHLTTYTLRPYFVGGAGLMWAISEPVFGLTGVSSRLPAVDVGGGVTGFLTRRIGIGWDVRYFRSVGSKSEPFQSFGPEQLSFWRANMAIAIRY